MHTGTQMHIHAHIHTRVDTYIHTYIHTCIHTCKYTYLRTLKITSTSVFDDPTSSVCPTCWRHVMHTCQHLSTCMRTLYICIHTDQGICMHIIIPTYMHTEAHPYIHKYIHSYHIHTCIGTPTSFIEPCPSPNV